MKQMQEFLENHEMNYLVAKRPAFVQGPDGSFNEVEGQYHLCRSTDGAVISPSTVSDRYAPMNPIDLVDPLIPMMAEGWISPEKGFLFKCGSYEVISFRIDGGQLDGGGSIAGEEWKHYLSVHNFQGGGGQARGSIHGFRIGCSNVAMRAYRMSSIKIRHTGDVKKNYDNAVETWKELQVEIRELSKRMEVFASTKVSAKDATEILQEIYGVKGKTEEEISTRTWNELEFAIREFSNPARETHGESMADIYNAITATNSHYNPKGSKETENKKLASFYDEQGSRNKLEAATVSLLSKLVGA